MHYTGMLALQIGIPVRYHWPTVLLSYVVGVAGSAVALSVISARGHRWWKLVVAAIALGGVGISGLHFTAMMAIRQQAMHEYSAALVISPWPLRSSRSPGSQCSCSIPNCAP